MVTNSLEDRMSLEPKEFFSRLSEKIKMLLQLRKELYGGSWGKMREDLKIRLEKRPHVYTIVERIEEDLPRIDLLEAYERLHRTNLLDYI